MTRALQIAGQLVVYAATAAIFAFFGNGPAYMHMSPDLALIKVSFVHSAQRVGECRRLGAEELAEIAANMRTAEVCPRGRLPVVLELRLDGETVYRRELPAAGLSADGPARIYARIPVSPGRHELFAGLIDSDREEGFDYTLERTLEIVAQDSVAIGFRQEMGGFTVEGDDRETSP